MRIDLFRKILLTQNPLRQAEADSPETKKTNLQQTSDCANEVENHPNFGFNKVSAVDENSSSAAFACKWGVIKKARSVIFISWAEAKYIVHIL